MSDENSNTCTICLEPLGGTNNQDSVDTTSFNSSNNENNSNHSRMTIGAVHPCGHVFHVSCWNQWATSRGNQGNRHPKCANCNNPSKGFCRIFLDLQNDFSVDDDDVSLSSHTEDDDSSDNGCGSSSSSWADENETKTTGANNATTNSRSNEHQQQVTSSSVPRQGRDSTVTSQEDSNVRILTIDGEDEESRGRNQDDNDSVIVVDVRSSEEQRQRPSVQSKYRRKGRKRKRSNTAHAEPSQNCHAVTLVDAYKYKRLAKRFKRRILVIQSQQQQTSKDQQSLREQLSLANEDITCLNQEIKMHATACDQQERRMEELELQVTTLRREKLAAQQRVTVLEKSTRQMQNELDCWQESHHRDLEHARATSMSEVRELLADHPRLTKENHALQEELRIAKRNLYLLGAAVKRDDTTTSSSSIGTGEARSSSVLTIKARRQPSKKTAKLLRSMETAVLPTKPLKQKGSNNESGNAMQKQPPRQPQKQKEEIKQCLQRSTHAAQLTRAIAWNNNKNNGESKRSALDLLEDDGVEFVADRPPTKRKQDTLTRKESNNRHAPTGATTSFTRVDADLRQKQIKGADRAIVAYQQQQRDIRTLFRPR